MVGCVMTMLSDRAIAHLRAIVDPSSETTLDTPREHRAEQDKNRPGKHKQTPTNR
jgi:hypothetical protein